MASLIRSNLYRDDQRKQEIPEYIQLFELVRRGDIDGTKEFLGASFDQKALIEDREENRIISCISVFRERGWYDTE